MMGLFHRMSVGRPGWAVRRGVRDDSGVVGLSN